jgi:hypothetical protein
VSQGVDVLDGPSSTRLLAFVEAHRMVEVALYGLAPLFGDSAGEARLASFINAARARGIEVAAPVAGADRVDALIAYAANHPEAPFATWVTELEYWHDCETETGLRPCYASLEDLLVRMAAGAARVQPRPRLAAYVGHPTPVEAEAIGRHVERVLVHHYGTDPVEAASRLPDRSLDFGAGVEVWPILYARGHVPMGEHLEAHGLDDTETAFRRALQQQRPELTLGGVQYFDFEALLRAVTAHEDPSGRR